MKIIKKMPDNCPLCGSGRTDYDFEEHNENGFPINFMEGWRCFECGARWVNKYGYVETEAYTEEEWEG